ncbi:MAG: hypothetical protein AB9891_07875 [Anaerolineaceae bacterium]
MKKKERYNMRQNYYIDPMMLVVHQRQKELLSEAAYDHLASEAKHILGNDGHVPGRKKSSPEITIWRRTAWSLGKAAFSLGTWLLAR